MDFFTALEISAAGLSAQRDRMNVISGNLANMQTTRTPEGGPYRKKSVVFEARPLASRFDRFLQDRLRGRIQAVRVVGVVESAKEPVRVYNPSHPDADADGYVRMPNMNLMAEMVDLLSASRSFEANVSAVSAAKSMALKALEIGR